jgi:hypothetical protein
MEQTAGGRKFKATIEKAIKDFCDGIAAGVAVHFLMQIGATFDLKTFTFRVPRGTHSCAFLAGAMKEAIREAASWQRADEYKQKKGG